jgi:hypothetical protein
VVCRAYIFYVVLRHGFCVVQYFTVNNVNNVPHTGVNNCSVMNASYHLIVCITNMFCESLFQELR